MTRSNSKGQSNIVIWLSYEVRVADAEMGSLYSREMARLRSNADAKQRLTDAQAAWSKYAESNCLFQAGPREQSGTVHPQRWGTCMLEHTKLRIEHLKNYVNCDSDGCTPPCLLIRQ